LVKATTIFSVSFLAAGEIAPAMVAELWKSLPVTFRLELGASLPAAARLGCEKFIGTDLGSELK
jgi:hypothetical protein